MKRAINLIASSRECIVVTTAATTAGCGEGATGSQLEGETEGRGRAGRQDWMPSLLKYRSSLSGGHASAHTQLKLPSVLAATVAYLQPSIEILVIFSLVSCSNTSTSPLVQCSVGMSVSYRSQPGVGE